MTAAVRRPGRLYGIADVGRVGADRLVETAVAMAAAGVTTIQVRAKSIPDYDLDGLCRRIFEDPGCREGELWIDDRVDLACLHPFSGVHLGQQDLRAAAARALLAPGTAVGLSTHTPQQVEEAEADPAVDWVAIGPVFATTSKHNPDVPVGLEGVAAARRVTVKPLVAIGGIGEENVASVLAAGADSVAVLSALCDGDVGANCRRLLDRIEASFR